MPLFAGQSREQLRRSYLDAWQCHARRQVLSPLQAQIVAVLEDHPEYASWLERGETALNADFLPEGGATNPFLHLGMHLTIRDQVATDRPASVRDIHRRLAARHSGDAHAAEHDMMESLGRTLWEAQRAGTAPDESAYLRDLRKLRGAPGAR